MRFFEVQLSEDYLTNVFSDITQEFVEHHMDNLYGAALRPYLRFIIKNMDWVCRQLVTARAKFNPKDSEDNKERFYRDTITTAIVAGKIAEKIGLISFDMKALKKWATSEVLQMRENRRETNMDASDLLAQFISSLHGRLIITKRFGDARTGHKEYPMEKLHAEAVGRVCTEDKKVYVTVKAVTDWCKENAVPTAMIHDEMVRQGYTSLCSGRIAKTKITLGKGTDVPSAQARCFELDYEKLYD